MVERRIGRGGMGVVYKVWDRQRERHLALKTLGVMNAERLLLFKNEFRALADVAHPNLIAFHEMESVGDQWFFTMELIDGVDLLTWVADPLLAEASQVTIDPASTSADSPPPGSDVGALQYTLGGESGDDSPPGQARKIRHAADMGRVRSAFRQLAAGLCALHAGGRLHCDIKPSNVMVTTEGRVVILDFGLVKALAGSQKDDRLAGTLQYMSPEQMTVQPLGPASDWYSAGMVLYLALTGALPFRSRSNQFLSLLKEKQRAEFVPPRLCKTGVDDDLEALCCDLLAPDPAHRPAGEAILRRLGGSEPAQHPATESLLVGRESHLGVLADALAEVQRGHPTLVHLHGISGMGKSALVRRFLDGLQHTGAVVLEGRCYERESVPYKALDSMIDSLSAHLAQLRHAAAAAVLPRHIGALAQVFPVLARVPAVREAPGPSIEPSDPAEKRRRASSALRELFARLGDRAPLVIHIDDLQWGDADSAEFLTELLRPGELLEEPIRLLLITSYREEFLQSPAAPHLPRTSQPGLGVFDLQVGPLSDDSAAALARLLLGPPSPEHHAASIAIARESGGSPFFVHELSRHAREHHVIGEALGMEALLGARLLRLPEEARRLLAVAAVAARPLSQSLFREVVPPRSDENATWAMLRAAHLVRVRLLSGREEIECFHDRIREIVLSHLDAAVVCDLHLRLARALETSPNPDPEELAEHFHCAGLTAPAARYAILAGEKAEAALAFERAAKLYRFALDLGGGGATSAERHGLRVRQGGALANAGRGQEAAEVFLSAAADAPTAQAIELKRRAAEQLLRSGSFEAGTKLLGEVLEALGLSLPPTGLAGIASIGLRTAWLRLRGFGFKARPAAEVPAAELARIDAAFSASLGLSLMDTFGGADFKLRNSLRALAAGEPTRVARAFVLQAAFLASAGGRGHAQAERLFEMAEALMRDHPNDQYAIGLLKACRSIAACLCGEWKRGIALCDQADPILREQCTGVWWEITANQLFAGGNLWHLGDTVELCRRTPILIREARARGDVLAESSLSMEWGNLVWLIEDHPDEARRQAEAAIARWPSDRFLLQHVFWLVAMTNADLYCGQAAGAHARIRATWPSARRSLLSIVQLVRVDLHSSRGRAAVAAAVQTNDPAARRKLLATAEADGKKLTSQQMPYATALGQLLLAGAAAARGLPDRAALLLDHAATGFAAADMAVYAAAASRARGLLRGGAAGDAEVAAQDRFMRERQIKNPARLFAMIAPGFG